MDAVPTAALEPVTTPVAPTTVRPPAWSGTVGLAVYAVLAWVYLLAFPQGLPLPTLDLSWSAIVARAGAEHWEFGRKIMLNYGPWAHLGIGFYYAPLFAVNYLFQLLSKVVLVTLICRVGLALPRAVRWPFLVANLIVGILEWEYIQTLAIVYAGWLASEDRTRAGRVIGVAGIVLAAAAGMMKTFYIVFGQAVFLCILVRCALREHGKGNAWLAGVWPLALFEGCLGADWLLAGQSLADVPAYLRGTLSLTDGHSRAMGFDPSLTIFLLAMALLGWTGVLGLVWFRRSPRATRLATVPMAALFAGSLFMAWKQGVTRADHFHLSGYFCFIVVFITTLPLFFDRDALPPAWHGANIVGVWALAGISMVVARPKQFTVLVDELATRPWHNLSIVFAPAAERARLDAQVEVARQKFSLPETRAAVGQARIDFVGTGQGYLLLNDLNYAPIPTLQGFLAYTPYLAALDAACYTPERAPEYVLFKNDPIDGHWATLDGALQIREILWNYETVLIENRCVLLRRKPAAACQALRPILRQEGEVALDTPLPVPPDGAEWCELAVHRTLLGRLIDFFYHEPTLIMETTMSDGKTKRSTLPPIMAEDGFVLHQPAHFMDQQAHLVGGEAADNQVTSICLGGTPLLRAAVGETVTYRFYHLDPPRTGEP